ncbi:hypothetical protein [Candidatus Enterococcus ferrettii]|uniref:Uncharacterized protein n=1 Tax=Candidatus Enterococcus ferrettii TaxID=2815324 RepID=A0ABV0EM85_9ENTE|nr:hypothetical protein [Enterococcus sp. 665A]MBO1338293.1 hypothetical protein [Enterococcus sp. 665A]
MPILAIFIDLITAAVYFLQLRLPFSGVYLLGIVFQVLFTLILLIMSFSYQGKRSAKIQTNLSYRYISIRYALILFSAIINGLVLFLYVLNFIGVNDLIFSQL